MVLAATILWSFEYILAKLALSEIHPDILIWSRMVFGLPAILLAVYFRGTQISVSTVSPAFILSVGLSGGLLSLYMYTWYRALRWAPVTSVSAVLVAAPAITLLLNRIFLSRDISQYQIISLIVTLVGIGFLTLNYFVRSNKIQNDSPVTQP